MPKRGRPPINKTIDDLDPALRTEVDEAIRSDANEAASSIFRRFGLATRGLKIDTFIKYARKVRQIEWTERPENNVPPTMQALMDQLLIGAYQAAMSGEMKPYEMASLIARVQEHDRIGIQKEAEARAAELHRIKLEQLSKTLKKDVDTKSENGTKTLQREDVYDMIDKIMRGGE